MLTHNAHRHPGGTNCERCDPIMAYVRSPSRLPLMLVTLEFAESKDDAGFLQTRRTSPSGQASVPRHREVSGFGEGQDAIVYVGDSRTDSTKSGRHHGPRLSAAPSHKQCRNSGGASGQRLVRKGQQFHLFRAGTRRRIPRRSRRDIFFAESAGGLWFD